MKRTSLEAGISMREPAKVHRMLILDVFAKSGRPMTSEMISCRCGLRYDQVWRRISELVNAGHLKDSGGVAATSSGRAATLWMLNELTLF